MDSFAIKRLLRRPWLSLLTVAIAVMLCAAPS